MSDLLQQAMIDAAALKEAAMKNAQNALIEKYSAEFNQTVQKLLEQEDVTAQPAQQNAAPPPVDSNTQQDLNVDATTQASDTIDLSAASADPLTGNDLTGDMLDQKDAFSKVPGSFSGDDEEMITINFDQIRSALNEMLGEAHDTKQQHPDSDALGKGGNPSMTSKVKSKNSVTEKWHEEELEEMTDSDEQNEGELEEMELMDEAPQQAPAQPTSQTSTQPDVQQQSVAAGQKSADSKEKNLIDKLKKLNPDKSQELLKDMRAAGLLKTPLETATAFGVALAKASPFIAGGIAGALGMQGLVNFALKMASDPQFSNMVMSSFGLREQELEEGDAVTAGADEMKRAADLKKQAADAEARGQTAIAKAASEEEKTAQSSTMEEEIELTEEELQELAEELRVDLKVGNLSDGYMGSTETQKREQRAVELAAARDNKAAEEREAELEKMKDLMQENEKLQALNNDSTKILSALKEQLENMNLINAKLLYTNKALGNVSLNERQKQQIVESISKADSVLAAKTIYETVQNAVENIGKEKEAPQSLRETLNRAATPYAVKKSASNSLNDLMADRMKALAGIKRTK
jgi:hypothetical protein